MTIAADLTKKIYTGNDVTTVFPYPFKIFQSTDLLVVLTDTTVTPNTEVLLTPGVDYTVSGVGDEAGGNVTYPISGDPLTTGEKLTNWRVPAILQGTDFQNQGGFHAETHEDSFDLATMISQYINEFVQRALALSVSDESGASLVIPGPEAGKVLGWNSIPDALINLDPGSVSLALPASDSIIADMINAAGTQATLTKLLSGNTAIWQKGADVASAAILPLLSDGNSVDVTGTDAVTSIATVGKGTVMILQFDGILIFTHHATDLFLCNDGNNITTAAGDHAIMEEYDTGKWRCVAYIRSNGHPIASTLAGMTLTAATLNTSVAGTAFQDDDSFASAASDKFASSESILALVTSSVAAGVTNHGHVGGADGEKITQQALLSYIAGDELMISADSPSAIPDSSSLTLHKEIRVARFGTLRIKFALHDDAAGQVVARIYRNNVPVGTERIVGDESYPTFSEDIAAWIPGDLCQLYVTSSTSTGELKEFRIYAENTFTNTVNLD